MEVRGNQEEKRGSEKQRESNLASNQLPICSPQPGTPRDIQCYIVKRRGRWKIKMTRRTGRVKRGDTDLAINQFLKCSLQPGTPREIHRVE